MKHAHRNFHWFRLVSIFLLAMMIGMPAASVGAAQPQANCALLDDPTSRALMSGMFESALLRACGRASELGQVSASATAGLPASPLLGADVQVNDSTGETGTTQTQSETSLAINENTGTICSAFNDSYSGVILGLGYTGFSRSTDGGATFVDGGGFGSLSFGDPSLIWRRVDGNFYIATLYNTGDLGLWRSVDDCATFQFLTTAHSGTSDDKELMVVDNEPTSPHYGRMYMAWTNFGAGSRIYVTTSDNTTTWTAQVALSAVAIAVQGAWPAVAPNGDVYVGWVRWDPYYTGPISIEIAKSTDGGTSWSLTTNPMSSQVNPYLQSATTSCGRPALNGNLRYLPSPQITVSPNGDLHAVYVYDTDGRNIGDIINVYYRRSTNGGTSWDPEIQLNDDGTTRDQFFPTLSAGPSGRLVATWYDRRLDAGNLLFTYWMRVSDDGGATWLPSVQVSDAASPVYLDPNLATCYHGDYDQQRQLGDTVYIQWSDDRNIHSGHNDPDVWFDKNLFVVATPGTLQGTVTDASTTLPISGALVNAGGGLSDLTDAAGFYQILNIPAGIYNVTASATGYTSSTANGVVVNAGGTTLQDFALTPMAVAGMHVGDLDGLGRLSASRWRAQVTIRIHDDAHGNVSGATVTGTWSGGATGTGTCTTAATGFCRVSSSSILLTNTTATFTVTNVTHATLTYISADNHDPDGDSTGTVITVTKP